MRFLKTALLTAGLLTCLTLGARATTYTWTGEVSNNNWEYGPNWSPLGIPKAGDTAIIGVNGATVEISIPEQADSIQIGSATDATASSALDIDTSSLTVTNTLYVGQFGAGSLTLSSPFSTLAPSTLTTGSTIIGALAGAGSVSIDGTWNNTGVINVGMASSNATLTVSETSSVTTGSILLGDTVNSSGVVTENGNFISSGTLQIGYQGYGKLDISSTGTMSASETDLAAIAGSTGVLNLSGSLTTGQIQQGAGTATVTFTGGQLLINGNQTGLFDGMSDGSVILGTGGGTIDVEIYNVGTSLAIAGSGGLTKLGTGTLTLSGANTYIGGTTVTEGTLVLGGDQRLSTTGAILVNGGTLDLSYFSETTGVVTLSSGTIQSGTLTASAYKMGSGTVSATAILTGSATLTEIGPGITNLYGTNTYTGGTVLQSGTLELDSTGAINTTGTITFTGGTLRYSSSNTLDYSSRFSTADNQQYKVDTNGQTVSWKTPLSSAGGSLTKVGAGVLDLSQEGDATYSGGTTITGGTVIIASDSNLGWNPTTFQPAGTLTMNGGTLENIANISSLSRQVVLTATSTFDVEATYLAFSQSITGAGGLIKTGSGELNLSSGKYLGATSIQSGTLLVQGSLASPSVDIASGATFYLTDDQGIFSSNVTGSGNFTLYGDGPTVLTGTVAAGVQTHVGITGMPQNFTLQVGNGGSAGTILGPVYLDPNGVLTVQSTSPFGASTAITFNGGTLQYSSGYTTDYSSLFRTAAGQQYKVDTNGQTATWASALSSSGGTLTKLGQGTLILSGANTYTGVTTILEGTLRATNLSSSGASDSLGTLSTSASNLVIDGGTLQYQGASTFSNRLFTIGLNGATLSTFGSSGIDFQNTGALAFTGSGAHTLTLTGDSTKQSGVEALIGDGTGGATSIVKSGTGTWALTNNNNSYTGTTTLNSGVLQVFTSGALGNGGTIVFNGGFLDYEFSPVAIDYSNRFSTTDNQQYNVIVTSPVTWASALTSAGGTLNKGGVGTLFLTGANTYDGTTTISQGTLEIGNGGTTGSLGTGAVVDGLSTISSPTLAFNHSDTFSFGNNISGLGAVIQLGTGTLTLTGSNTYSGVTTLSSGTLVLQSSGALSPSTSIVWSGGTLQYVAGYTTDYSSQFSSAANQQYRVDTNGQTVIWASALASSGGTLTKLGQGTLILSGTNTYTGATTILQGTLQAANLSSSGTSDSLGTLSTSASSLVIDGGTLQYQGAFAFSNRLFTIGLNGATLSTSGSGAIDFQNTGALAFTGSGAHTLTLTGDSTKQSGVEALIGDGTGGATSIVKSGTSTWALTNNNSYTGTTTLNGGVLQVFDSGALGNGGTIIFNGGFLDYEFSPVTTDYSSRFSTADNQQYNVITFSPVTWASALSSSGGTLTKGGSGTLFLTGANTYDGTTTISQGTLEIGNGGTTGSLGSGAVVDGTPTSAYNPTLAFNHSDSFNFGNDISGTGAVIQLGTGTLMLTGTNTYSGGTTISSGTLSIGSDAQLGAVTGTLTMNGGTLQDSADILSNRQVVLASNSTFAVGIGYLTFYTPFSGNGGLTKTGTNYLTLTGNQTYSGATVIQAGSLKLESGSMASPSVNLASGTDFYLSDSTGIFSPDITGSGTFHRGGAGTSILTGSIASTVQTDVADGTLQVGNGGTSGSIAGNVDTGNGTLAFNRSDDVAYSGTITGNGSVNQAGTGTVSLSGLNTYKGGTTVSAGTLAVAGNLALGTGNVNVSSGTLQIGRGYNIANAITLSGGTLAQDIGAGTELSTIHAYDGLLVHGTPTQARFLGGVTSADATINGSFKLNSTALNDYRRMSDVFSLSGVPVVNTITGETDTFVLQLQVTGDLTEDSRLGWYDPAFNMWVNAVDGNFGGTDRFVLGAYNAAEDFQLGTYGVDIADGTVWAVLNHNSDFAIYEAPEPSTWVLLGLGFAALIGFRRANRRSRV